MTEDTKHQHDDRPLRRACDGRMIAGVAEGLAAYLDVDVTVVRLGIAALTLAGGVGLPLYAAAWLLVPEECSDESVAEQFIHHRHAV
jgi:phage shock protein PspC (stress-responsive transcriptional regulator)